MFFILFYLYSLDLRGLDDRGLGCLNHPVHLNRLAVGQLHQGDCGTAGRNLCCRYGSLQGQESDKPLLKHGFTMTSCSILQ